MVANTWVRRGIQAGAYKDDAESGDLLMLRPKPRRILPMICPMFCVPPVPRVFRSLARLLWC